MSLLYLKVSVYIYFMTCLKDMFSSNPTTIESHVCCTVPVVSLVETVPCYSDKGRNFTAIKVFFNETVGNYHTLLKINFP